MKEIIVITAEGNYPDEVARWNQLFESGLQKLHVRKPSLTAGETGSLLAQVHASFRSRITIHYHPQLAVDFGLGGVHFSYLTVPLASAYPDHTVSCSVHNWSEQKQIRDAVDYCLISPVFDSISKRGYRQNTGLWPVPTYLSAHNVYALGGINQYNLGQVLEAGFAGAALLGAVWQATDPVREFVAITQELQTIKEKGLW